jgi:hypothetical protein
MVGDHTTIRSLAMTSDGRWLAATHGGAVRLFALPPPQARRLELRGRALIRAMPARGELVAVVHDDSLFVYDPRSGARRPLLELGERVTRLAASVTGTDAAASRRAIGWWRWTSSPAPTVSWPAGRAPGPGSSSPGTTCWPEREGRAARLGHDRRAPAGRPQPDQGPTGRTGGDQGWLARAGVFGARLRAGRVASGRSTMLDFAGGSFMREAISQDGSKLLISLEDGTDVAVGRPGAAPPRASAS